jgi:isoleucyl-tRNA synthetase
VHLTLFPKPEELAPNMTLEPQWVFLLTLRSDVLSQLEILRTRKEIGKSLEANVVFNARDESFELLLKYQSALPELFNVSHVDVRHMSTTDGQFLGVQKIDSPKCDRCWRHVPDVGHNDAYPTVCLRCAEALDAIDFPHYSAATSTEN